ncbi:MAG: hypothetical protein KGD70_11390 [Candidatus Lokiarchaeota archaeon]|nr:hypothetical protein [Candidatus Lokiarchaeota archaeon]
MEPKRKKLIIIISLIVVIVVAIIIPVTLFLGKFSFNTSELGQIFSGGVVTDVEIEGDIAYVVDSADNNPSGLVIVNISNPYHPYILGSYYQSGLPYAVDVVGDIAVLANIFVGVEILNISDLTNPVKTDQYTGSGAAFDVQVVGEITYVADWSRGLVLLNISDPSHVSEISRFSISGACTQVYVDNGIAYITDHHISYTGIRLINVSNPQSPFQVGSYAPADIDFWNPYVHEKVIYVANHGNNGGELHVLSANNYSQISPLGVFDDGGLIYAAFTSSNKVYAADYQYGLIIIDMTDFSNPVVIGRHFDGGHSVDVVVVGDIAYVADREDGLEIIRV